MGLYLILLQLSWLVGKRASRLHDRSNPRRQSLNRCIKSSLKNSLVNTQRHFSKTVFKVFIRRSLETYIIVYLHPISSICLQLKDCPFIKYKKV